MKKIVALISIFCIHSIQAIVEADPYVYFLNATKHYEQPATHQSAALDFAITPEIFSRINGLKLSLWQKVLLADAKEKGKFYVKAGCVDRVLNARRLANCIKRNNFSRLGVAKKYMIRLC